MARYQTEFLFDNQQILLFMNDAESPRRFTHAFSSFRRFQSHVRDVRIHVKRIRRDLSTHEIDNVVVGN